MKKLKILSLLGLLICVVATLFACGSNRLSVPTYLSIDQENRLVWSEIDDARSYKLAIKNVDTGITKESTSNRPYKEIGDLNLEEGDYEIKIKALGNGRSTKDSKWSRVFFFHKDYETGCIYSLVNNVEYEITRVGSASGTFTIEDLYRGKPVVRIAANAFKGSSRVENIVIGNNVQEIGDTAFYQCKKLVSVTIPDSVVTIGSSAFQWCSSLKSVSIPDSVTEIKDYTFTQCRALESVDLGEGVKTIGTDAFSNCYLLKSVEIPDSVETIGEHAFANNTVLESVTIGSSLVSLGDYAFYKNTALKTLQFSDEGNLQTIGQYAFADCDALEGASIPEGVVSLGAYTFDNCDVFDTVTLPNTLMRLGGSAFTATKFYKEAIDSGKTFIYAGDWLIAYKENPDSPLKKIELGTLQDGVVGIADAVFSENENLREVTLPYTIRSIGGHAFEGCKNLWFLRVPDVPDADNDGERDFDQIIGEYAFAECGNLMDYTFGEGLVEIGENAFLKCKKVTNTGYSSFIPSTVRRIGSYAFKDTGLWSEAEDGVVYAGDWVVGYTGGDATVTLRDGSDPAKPTPVGIADYAFYQCGKITRVENLHYVKYLGRAAFYECTSLGSAELSDNLRTIEDYTFYKCTSLLIVSVPPRLESIGRSAFYKCEKLNRMDLSLSTVKSIGMNAFFNCTNLKNLDLGYDLESIGTYAFYGAASVTELVIPDTVTEIGDRAFAEMSGLTKLTIGAGVETIPECAFWKCTSLEEIMIPSTVKEIKSHAFYKNSAVKKVLFVQDGEGNGVETIGNSAFSGLELITELNLPSSLKHVGDYAFMGANGVTSLFLSKNLEYVGKHAFYGCKGMTVYTDATSGEVGWNERWNSSYRPTVWGVQLSEDGTYVESIRIQEDLIVNINAAGGFVAPLRKGYTFGGWKGTVDGETKTYQANELTLAPIGTVLRAIWTPNAE